MINERDENTDTALMRASKEGGFTSVKRLVEDGADLNLKGLEDYTALLYATGNDEYEIVKYLISRGADMKCATEYGENLFDTALDNGDFDIIKYVLDNGGTISKYFEDYIISGDHLDEKTTKYLTGIIENKEKENGYESDSGSDSNYESDEEFEEELVSD
jgi:ankyrin repeat protein